MYPAVIGFVFAILNLFLVPTIGDMLMRSKTYDIRATAIDKEGKVVNVSGTLIDFKLLIVGSTSEREMNNDNYTFSIVAKEVNNNSLDDSDTDCYKLNAFATPNSRTNDSSKLLPYSEKNMPPNLPLSSLLNKNLSCQTNKTQTKFHGTENLSTAKFDNAPSQNISSTRFTDFPQLPLFRNMASAGVDATQTPSTITEDETATPFDSIPPLKNSGLPPKCLQNHLSAGGVVPQTSQLNVAQLYPKSSNDAFNDTIRTGLTDAQVPPQNFHTELSRQGNMEPHSRPDTDVFDRNRKNSETCQGRGPKADDTLMSHPLKNSIEKAVPMEQTFDMQNLSVTPVNNATSINLAPVSGEPWTNLTGENSVTQLYANTPKLNFMLPLRNVSVSDNSSGYNNTIEYASVDAPSLLQKFEPVNDTTITQMVEDYLVNEENDATTIDGMDLVEEIIEEVNDIMKYQTEMDEGPAAENISTEFPPTMSELVEIVEVIANDDQEIETESTTWAETTHININPTTISYDNATTESNGSGNISNGTYMTTETTPSTAKGNKVVSSTLVVLLVAVSILTRTTIN